MDIWIWQGIKKTVYENYYLNCFFFIHPICSTCLLGGTYLQDSCWCVMSSADVWWLLLMCDDFKFTKKTLYITAYDFEQAFDSMWLGDCIVSLKEIGVEKEYLQLIYNLNKSAAVTVQTPAGETPLFKTDPIVKLTKMRCSSRRGKSWHYLARSVTRWL